MGLEFGSNDQLTLQATIAASWRYGDICVLSDKAVRMYAKPADLPAIEWLAGFCRRWESAR